MVKSIVNRDDFSYLTRVGRDFDRLFKSYPFMGPRWYWTDYKTPDTDIKVSTDDKTITYTFEVPGIPKDDVKLRLDGNTLSVMAVAEGRSYSYSITIDDNVDKTKPTARLADGLLSVSFPVLEKKDEDKEDGTIIPIE